MKILIALFLLVSFEFNAHAAFQENLLDELDPRSPDIEDTLQQLDDAYSRMMDKSPFESANKDQTPTCYRNACPVWARANLAEQMMYVYVDGAVKYVWLISSGKPGYETPLFDENPNGRIYDHYSSSTYPGGDYNGLGNMPYAVFIRGGYAVHGTVPANWPKLGTPASKGCLRLHPDNAMIFNRLVRAAGVASSWVTVE